MTGSEAYAVVAIGAATLSSGTLALAVESTGTGFDSALITQGTIATVIVGVSLFFIRRADRAAAEQQVLTDARVAVERKRHEDEMAKKDELIENLLTRLLDATPPSNGSDTP